MATPTESQARASAKAVTLNGRRQATAAVLPAVAAPAASPSGDSVAKVSEVQRTARSPCRPVVYRSDANLWPPGVQGRPLEHKQRADLARLASVHGERLRDCSRDLEEAEAKAAAVGAGPEKDAFQGLCEVLREEVKRIIQEWCGLAEALQAGWAKPESLSVSAPSGGASGAVRPLRLRGERWFCASLETPSLGRVLGPLRPSAEAAARDRKALAQAAQSRESAGAARPPTETPREARPGRKASRQASDASSPAPRQRRLSGALQLRADPAEVHLENGEPEASDAAFVELEVPGAAEVAPSLGADTSGAGNGSSPAAVPRKQLAKRLKLV